MEKAIKAAKSISEKLDSNAISVLKDTNLYKAFEGIYRLNVTNSDANKIVCFIIYSFDPDSPKLDLRKDRLENKKTILESLGGDPNTELFSEILANNNEEFNNAALNYLEIITDWRWPTIFSLMDYHSNMLRFANQKTEAEKSVDRMNKEGEVKTLTQDYDVDTIAAVNKKKGELLTLAIESREKADKLLAEIRKDFMHTDVATQSDFNFTYTETAKSKVDILSWRSFIRDKVIPLRKQQLNGR